VSRQTIDFGIDLGTTNSAVAVLNGADVQIIKSAASEVQMDYTPSAVWIDQRGRIKVGRVAKERETDVTGDVAVEFKLKMGKTDEHTFPSSGKTMTPEALSAEVLKALRNDVRVAMSEEIESAVITVPAAFELPQCAATTRAAKAAGFHTSPLLQEPSAAALAYGFQSEDDNSLWLVYDLGGGTFDAALVKLRDGEISPVNHAGDNHLGGKFLDWEIVERLLIPAVVKQQNLSYFERGNVEWQSAIAKLKYHAEIAKIRLSGSAEQEIEIEDLCNRDRSRTFDFNFTLRRCDIEKLFDPIIDRTVRLCRKVLEEKDLRRDHVSKLILVGGPTLTPYLRERLRDSNSGLGIPLDFHIDPLTAVAKGAAIFAGTQRLAAGTGGSADRAATPGTFTIEFSAVCPIMGSDPEPEVFGRVVMPEGQSASGFTIEFINRDAQPAWRSGKVGLSSEGQFTTELWAEKGRLNTFVIELCDATGRPQTTTPAQHTYIFGNTVSDRPPLINSLGVALVGNMVRLFLTKGTSLPGKKTCDLHSTVEVRPGEAKDVLCIPVVEGENTKADRNILIGSLLIPGTQVQRTVPAGSSLEVTVECDASRNILARAYVPILDQDFEAKFDFKDYGKAAMNPEQLSQEVEEERRRFESLREKAREHDVAPAQEAARKVEAERVLSGAQETAAKAKNGDDEAERCHKRLLELRVANDKIEDALAWPQLVTDAEKELADEKRLIADPKFKATSEDKQQVGDLERNLRRAIEKRDTVEVKRTMSDLSRIGYRILVRLPGFWLAQLDRLAPLVHRTSDPSQAQRFVDQGRRAIERDDVDALKAAVVQIVSLMPNDDPERDRFGATVGA
jgi:molecular chaperone DnaK